MDATATTVASLSAAQSVLYAFQSILAIGGYMCPAAIDINTATTMSRNGYIDYIIVGGGTAGAVLANRLTECPDVNVFLIEAGGCPALESIKPAYFTMQPLSYQDYNMTSVDDGYACQNLQGNSVGVTIGKMLGGSSGIHHMIHATGSPQDYEDWASITGDSTWRYSNVMPYLKKMETVKDSDVMSEFDAYHGTSGPVKLKRQLSSANDDIIAALEEMGHIYKTDTNNDKPLGVVSPLLGIDDGLRQSSLTSYLYPIKNRKNLFVMTSTTVNKVTFSGTTANGVEISYNGKTYTLNSNKIIISAGAIQSPQLLMLSGVGDPKELRSVGITPVVENKHVGKKLSDHVSACMVFTLDDDASPAASPNPNEFPAPTTCLYTQPDISKSYASYQSINLVFPHDSSGLLQLCVNVFKYKPEICNAIAAANVGKRVLFTVPNILTPKSRGSVGLSSSSISDQPVIKLNLLNDTEDLVNLASFLGDLAEIVNTTTFKNLGAKFVDLGLCSDYTIGTADFWECYTLAMSSTMWHYSGSCSLGSCLDSNFNVVGAKNLQVVDASAMPQVIRGNIGSAVLLLAEMAADIIKDNDGLTCSAK